MNSNICFIDFETTGIDVFNNDPVQFAAILVDKEFNILKQFKSLMRIGEDTLIDKNSMKIHGIPFTEIENAPNTSDVLKSFFYEFGTDYCFAGWNISFDVPFFKKAVNFAGLQSLGNKIDYRHVDVQTVAKVSRMLNILPNDVLSLSDLSKYFQLKRGKNHDALEDVNLTIQVFKNLLLQMKSHNPDYHYA